MILELLGRIPDDKLRHFFVGALVAAIGGLYSLEAGALLCAAVALGKEFYDRKSRKGTPSRADALWTLGGGVVALLGRLVELALGFLTGA